MEGKKEEEEEEKKSNFQKHRVKLVLKNQSTIKYDIIVACENLDLICLNELSTEEFK